MAFNGGAPFGRPAQPAFGQPLHASNPFGTASGSNSPPSGKITFGARATTKQPAAVATAVTQPATDFGAGAGSGLNGFSQNSSSGNSFGQHSTTQDTAPFDDRVTPAASTGGFGAISRLSVPVGGGQQTGQAFGSFGGGQQTGQGFGTFSGGQQSSAGFGTFGGAAAISTSSTVKEPSWQSPFTRLGARIEPQPAKQDQSLANGIPPNPFASFGQQAQTPPTMSSAGGFGAQQSAFGFGASGANPFAGPANGSQVKLGDFGRAAKRQQPELQQPQHPADAQQRPKSAATLLPRQISNQAQQGKPKHKFQQQTLSNELADPAALAARSARFGSTQQESGVFNGVSGALAADQGQSDQQQDADGNDNPEDDEGDNWTTVESHVL